MTVDAVRFNPNTRFTKKGNHYQKTNLGKTIGTIAGAGFAGVRLASQKEFLNKTFYSIASQVKNGAQIEPLVKTMKIGGYAGAAAIFAALGLGLGAVIDGVANKIKAYKADKAAKTNA